ncbi:MAG: glycosyltransferase family 2 protein [Candidatus Eisenbacteria bacterium]|uniref:Glycosyltransferase family 2 protein n=1 Tax=Eiseniibacteriota bacterium TaxID=2212470 RepID=A0A538U8J4_UNCEI|nr:MAG: glycosyltransferase family 2 protein [Candidatus Eisenbacteria bacterium]
MADVKVSVCIPTYRHPELVRRALDSVLAQTGVSLEIVISDDSPDDAVERVVADCGGSGRVRYFRNPSRLGSPENWNQAVRRAEGDYVKLLHHDDYLTTADGLHKFVALLEDHPEADLGFSASEVWMVGSGDRWVHHPTAAQLRDLASRPQGLFAANVIGSPSAVIFRRTVTPSFDPRLIWLVDVDFYIRVLEARPGFGYCPEPLVCTANGDWQITAQVRGDTGLQLFEHLVVFDRIQAARGLQGVYLKAWANLFARHGVVSLDQIRRSAGGVHVPEVRLQLALWLARLLRLRDRWRGRRG